MLFDLAKLLAERSASLDEIAELTQACLAPSGLEYRGTSSCWPIAVTFSAGSRVELRGTDEAGLRLAHVEERFGPPRRIIRAKEGFEIFKLGAASISAHRLIVEADGGTSVGRVSVYRLNAHPSAQADSPP
jgi:hypothetical protein